VAALEPEDLTALGFSRAKAAATVGLARTELDLDGLAALPDDEVSARLVALPGIGEWTADWFLARHLGRPRAWPAGDLGVRKALARFLLEGRDPSPREARDLAERFSPYENLSAQYLLLAMRRLS
jgi:DNA-3-methyladenine glycosylase II